MDLQNGGVETTDVLCSGGRMGHRESVDRWQACYGAYSFTMFCIHCFRANERPKQHCRKCGPSEHLTLLPAKKALLTTSARETMSYFIANFFLLVGNMSLIEWFTSVSYSSWLRSWMSGICMTAELSDIVSILTRARHNQLSQGS